MKYLKIILTISLLMSIGYLVFQSYINLYTKGSFAFVFEADKDDSYDNLLFVKKVKGEQECNRLVQELLEEKNRDLLTKLTAIRYINENNKKEFIPALNAVKTNFEKIGPDSTWEVAVKNSGYRLCYLKNTAIVPYLDETIKKLSVAQ
ncbi:hypothetical protein [Ferruginibacter sp. SUN106]|uniref:hypothetical protein n=1 Tax=Ferruginibacter sp. SUN106 TaxID=2978348 RepID=UPI003D36A709